MNGKQYELVFIIVNKGLKPLLGALSIQMLNLMSINNQNVMSLDTSSHTTPKAEDILMRYTNVFIGDGKLQEELHLEVNKDMVSVKLPVRKAPVALKEAVADNNRKLHSLLQCCREKGIKLNKDKLKLKKKEVTFMGHVISAEGLKPDPTKIEAAFSMPTPTNKQDVRRLLGMVKLPPESSESFSKRTCFNGTNKYTVHVSKS